MNKFELSVKELDGVKVINFINKSRDFVEVVFAIDGKEIKDGKIIDNSSNIKGYGYTPKLEKPVKRMRDGSPLRFSEKGGEVVAYIFFGDGEYKIEDLDKPAFLRNQLVDKIKFKRTSNKPSQTIKAIY